MTNDELRALADCLDDPNAMQRTARRKAADYLRAQADAQPVGILTVARFRGHLENRDFDYTGELPDGNYPLYAAPAAPQADPKREPLSDERIAEIQRAAYERAAQECIETAAELRRCADGCTDGRYDWKADGADDCADAIRALGSQHD